MSLSQREHDVLLCIADGLVEKEIANNYIETLEDDITLGVVNITPGAFSTGFELYDADLIVFSTEELFEAKPTKRLKTPGVFKDGQKIVFADLKEGDYIVHKTHGIGQYLGVNTIKADGITKDYIKLKYKDDDVLYIPTDSPFIIARQPFFKASNVAILYIILLIIVIL